MKRQFLTLADVADMLSISAAQAYALVRRGELRAIKLGENGQWRVEETEFNAYIERLYSKTDEMIGTNDGAAT